MVLGGSQRCGKTAVASGAVSDQSLPARAASRAQLVLLLGALSAFGPVSLDTYLPGLPELSRDLGASASAAQLTLTTCLIGLALGQVIAGPLSDALGRRRPLLGGLAVFALASLACAAAPDVWTLAAARLVQGVAGAAGIVIGRAVVRDLYEGSDMARFLALMLMVNGVGPIAAPIVGGQLLHVTSWRGVFVVLAGFGALLLGWTARALRESLDAERRHRGGLTTSLRVFRELLADRRFLGYVLSCGFVFAAMFAYIAGSPFVLQGIHGVSEQGFSLIFGVNAAGIMGLGWLSSRLFRRWRPAVVLRSGLSLQVVGALGLVAVVAAGAGLLPVLICLFLVVASVGLVFPSATTLALADHPESAGSASGLLGVCQFVFGALAAPIVGLWGEDTALPMALTILACALIATVAYRLLVGRSAAVA
jgi:DHA1 family bicyclomycin/chloramphenicol resistance-like MFS transporter